MKYRDCKSPEQCEAQRLSIPCLETASPLIVFMDQPWGMGLYLPEKPIYFNLCRGFPYIGSWKLGASAVFTTLLVHGHTVIKRVTEMDT
jgi:hypothetical protein